MSLTRPTLTTLVSRAKSDIATRMSSSASWLRQSVEGVLARVTAGAAHGLHGHLVWLSRQLIPDTAEDEIAVRWAAIWDKQKIAAVKAAGNLTVTGTDATYPGPYLWQTSDGVVYVQAGAVTIAGGTGTAALEAQVAGVDGNQVVGVKVTLVSPVPGINSEGTVSGAGLVGGLDEETVEALRARLLQRLQSAPSGGGPGDYEGWALEVAGTTRVWQVANANGLGSVGLWFVMDNKPTTIIPTAGEVAVVQAYLDTVAPVTADVTVYAPTAVALNLTIDLTPDTTAVRAAVTTELQDYLLRAAAPIVDTAGVITGVTLLWSQINEAISIAAGETDHILTVPAANVVYAAGQLPVLGTITWV